MASSNNSNRLAELEGKLRAFIDHGRGGDDDDGSGHSKEVLIAILRDSCNLLRDADVAAPDFKKIVNRVDQLINRGVDYAYNGGDLCDFMQSFAHSEAYPELDGKIVQQGELELGMFQHWINLCNTDYPVFVS